MRGKTLLQLLDDLRVEAGYSQNVAANRQHRDSQVKYLQRAQEWFWQDFDWPHLQVERYIPVQAGQRFYDPTDSMDVNGDKKNDLIIDRVISLQFKWGNVWCDVVHGIGPLQYSVWDSNLDQRSWPVERWRIYESELIELWPIPGLNASDIDQEGYLKINGIRNLRPLVNDSDRADIDNQIITQYAAAEFIDDKDEAARKLAKANKRYGNLRAELMPRTRRRMFLDGPDYVPRIPRGPYRIAYRTDK